MNRNWKSHLHLPSVTILLYNLISFCLPVFLKTSILFLIMIAVKAFIVLVVAVAAVSAQGSIGVKNVIIDNYFYFTDTSNTLRTRQAALLYCASLGAELAKVTSRKEFLMVQMAFPVLGRYWIDGVDKDSQERFELDDRTCSRAKPLDFLGMDANLNLAPQSCLSFLKGNNASTTKIEAVPCTTTARVLCGYPVDGCPELTSTTTTSPGGL